MCVNIWHNLSSLLLIKLCKIVIHSELVHLVEYFEFFEILERFQNPRSADKWHVRDPVQMIGWRSPFYLSITQASQ